MSQNPRTVKLSRSLYPPDALCRARTAFEPLCRVDITSDSGEDMVRIEPFPDAPPNTVDEFLNYLLSAAIELHLGGDS